MKYYVGVTDFDWYDFLRQRKCEDVNFWQPGGHQRFRALNPGEPFLFKLKSPYNAIVGVGFFSSHTFLPISVAWNIFGIRNGTNSFIAFQQKIDRYRSASKTHQDIGCIVLTDPIFFEERDWVSIPTDWHPNIVQGKTYDTDTSLWWYVWYQIEERLSQYQLFERSESFKSQLILEDPTSEYSKKYLTRVRLGQGAFRVQLTDAYNRKCAISGEKTLPALEAAHIKPFSESGPYHLCNGILLRADLHKLLDFGYLTITTNHYIEVSRRIRQEFENGKEYYQFHGKSLSILPGRLPDRPNHEFIEWHNRYIYKE